ncbi:MAG TPA: TfoX/Sxy family protein [Solirubrobacterales bacterium]|nr:TfoX/Sxy family protein [Solirubrobacterales bacterium]
MAYDADLAERVRDAIALRDGLSEREMFGGIGFMVGGNMACGVLGDELIVRLAPADAERALAEEHTRVFDYSGRPMKGWIFVASEGLGSDDQLAEWVDAGADFAASLPSK